MDTNKTFIFMLIVAVIFIGIMIFNPFKGNESATVTTTTTSTTSTSSSTTNTNNNQSTVKNTTSESTSNEFEIIDTPQEKQYDLTFENKNIKVEFDPNDAVIKHAWVKDTFLNRKEINMFDLVQGKNGEGALRLKFGSWENEITLSKLTGGNSLFNYTREGNNFIFICNLKNKSDDSIYTIKKVYKFVGDENVFNLDVEIINNKNKPINFDGSGLAFSIAWGPLLGLHSRNNDPNNKPQYNYLVYLKGNDFKKVNEGTDLVKKNNNFGLKEREGNETWIANSEHYFTSIILPDNQNYKYLFDYRDMKNQNIYYGLSRNTNEKSELKSNFYVFIGPKINSILGKYDNPQKNEFQLNNANFAKVIEPIMIFGRAGNFFIDRIGDVLNFIYNIVKNYGLAILIITFLIKLLIAPLTHSSMVSQEKMSLVQPKIKALQEKYKDKPEVLNKETMDLYKREGINPFGGCLPLLLQMPILMAMYSLLDTFVELKGASFLWIKDLSLPDSVFQFPFIIPFVNISSLNILPFVMTGVSIVATLLMPSQQSNKQAQMMMWMMPLIFLFLFYNVSSGLVLYWTAMNLLNMIQQVYVNYFRKKIVKKA